MPLTLEEIQDRVRQRAGLRALQARVEARRATGTTGLIEQLPVGGDTRGLSPEAHEQIRQSIEGPGAPLAEDFAPVLIAGSALTPIVAPAVGIGVATWRTATTLGRLTHGALDFITATIGEYGLVQPLARHAEEIHPALAVAVELVGGPASAFTFEAMLLKTSIKALSKTAPKFWSNQMGALSRAGHIPTDFQKDLSDLARNADKGSVEDAQKFMIEVRDIAYNKRLSEIEEKASIKAAKAPVRNITENTKEVIKEVENKIATGSSLTEVDIVRLSNVAQRDAIHEYVPEFDSLKNTISLERATSEWAEHPNKDYISLITEEGGIFERSVKTMFESLDDGGEAILKRLKVHKGLVTTDGGADLAQWTMLSETKSVQDFVKALADTPSLAKMTRSHRAKMQGEFDRIFKEEIFSRTAAKQSDYLGAVMGDKTKPLTVPGASKAVSSQSASRVVKEIVALRKVVERYSRIIAREAMRVSTDAGKAKLSTMRESHKKAISQLLLRVRMDKEATKINGYLKSTVKMSSMHPEYRQQIQNFLSPLLVGPGRKTLTESMFQFLNRKYTENLSFGADILAEKYNTMLLSVGSRPLKVHDYSLDQLRDIEDFVRSFRDVAANEKYIVQEANKLWLNGIAGKISLTAQTTIPKAKFLQPTQRGGVVDYTKGTPSIGKASQSITDLPNAALASLKRVEFIVRQLDGWEDFGTAWKTIWKPMKDAEILEQRLGTRLYDKYQGIVKKHKDASGMRIRAGKYWNKRLPQIGRIIPTKKTAVAMALNSGNEGNMSALLRHINGPDAADSAAEAVTSKEVLDFINTHLSKADFKYVDDVHKLMDKDIFPLLAKSYKEVVSQDLQRITGKYYPIVSNDVEQSLRHNERLTDVFMGTNAKTLAGVERSMIMSRVDGVKELDLTLDPILRHIRDSVHFTTHWKPIQDTQSIIKNTAFRNAVTDTMGRRIYEQFDPWLKNLARPSVLDASHRLQERTLRRLRGTMSVAALGLKLSTAAKQSLSLITALPDIGTTNTLASIAKMMANPMKLIRAVSQASPEMSYRSHTWQREIMEMMQSNLGKKQGLKGTARNTFFYFIHAVDRITASTVWQAAYMKGMDDFVGDARKAAEFADIIVKKTQPAAAAKDLPAVMRSGETQRLISMFYGYFSVWHNQVAEVIAKGLAGNMTTTSMLSTLAFLTAAPVVAWHGISTSAKLIVGREVDPEKSKEELMKKLFVSPLAGVPIARDLASSIIFGYDTQVTPVQEILVSIGTVGNAAFEQIFEDDAEITTSEAMSAAATLGYLTRIPSFAFVTALEGAIRLSEGETQDYTELLVKP